MNRIYKKGYNVLLSSFTLRAFFGIIVVSSLFACGGVSKEDLEEVEKKATEEVKAAKEETEKVKKELEAKITVLEGSGPAVITGANYTNIQGAVGLNLDGTVNVNAGLAKDVEDLETFKQDLEAFKQDLETFKQGIQVSLGLDDVGNLTNGLTGVDSLIKFKQRAQASLGLDANGDVSPIAVNGIGALKTDVTALKTSVAAMPAKIVKGVNALGNQFTIGATKKSGQIKLTDL